MLKRCLIALAVAVACSPIATAGYLDEDPDKVFAAVYRYLGITLPVQVARDPYVWLRLSDLKRERCDQRGVTDLANILEKLGRRREAANALYHFVLGCGAPASALHTSVNILLKLTDYRKATEVADEFVRRAPTNHNAYYLRGVAFEGVGDFRRALADYSDSIELYGADKMTLGSQVFTRMANTYANLDRYCEAITPILTWVAFDPLKRDTSQTQKIVADYERRGNCAAAAAGKPERYPLRGQTHVVTVKAEINGIRGAFILDTGASYVSLKRGFAERAKISLVGASEVRMATAAGALRAKLARADKVRLGQLEARSVPVVVQDGDDRTFGAGIDGLLGMSFLSRFEVQMARGYIEIRSRRRQ